MAEHSSGARSDAAQAVADPGKEERSARGIPVVPAYDAFRGVAVLSVVLFHVLASSGLLIRAGESAPAQLVWGTLPFALPVFFIVSGFVMFLPTAVRDGEFGSPRVFAVRRAARLLPALWLALTIALALAIWLPNSNESAPGAGEAALNYSGLSGWATLWPGDHTPGFGVDPPVWTLTVEIVFYLVLPVVAATYFRRPLIGLAVAAAIAVLWRETFQHLLEVADFFGVSLGPERAVELQFGDNQFPQWSLALGAGMTSAWAYVRLRQADLRETAERLAPAALLGSGVVIAICIWQAGRHVLDTPAAVVVHEMWHDSPLIVGYTAALAAFMLALSFIGGRTRALLARREVRVLADISYGIYLIHAVLLWTISRELTPPHSDLLAKDGSVSSFLIIAALVFPLAVAYGYLSARFVEQPIRRAAHRYGRRAQRERTAKQPAATAASLSPTPRPEDSG